MRSVLQFAGLVLVLASLNVNALRVQQSECPVRGVAPQVWQQNLQYGTKATAYNWYISPCQAAVPASKGNCTGDTKGYFGEYDIANGTCNLFLTTQTSEWVAVASPAGPGYTSAFKNAAGDRLAVTILCAVDAGNLEPVGDVLATKGRRGTFEYSVVLNSAAVCVNSSTPVPQTPTTEAPQPNTTVAPASSCPVSGVVPQVWKQDQQYKSNTEVFEWFLSPCKRGFPTGGNEKSCEGFGDRRGYFGEWDIKTGNCQTMMNTITDSPGYGWVQVSDGYRAVFEDPGHSKTQVTIECDQDAGNLEPVGTVKVTDLPRTGAYLYEVLLRSNAVCNTTAAH